jgi:antibiotic biosynthesis monooxygenase (ABM) superfamily enzyme
LRQSDTEMITCYLRYEVDPDKLADFEAYGAMWLELMPRFGGIHHGYFLPSEGESDVALAMFSFERSFFRPLLPKTT